MAFILNENSLLDKIVAGDTEAENHLFVHFKERIEFLVRVRLRGKVSVDDQADIVSEAKQAILLSLRKGGFDPQKGNPVEAYIAGIVSNIVAMYFRKLSKEKITSGIDNHHSIESPENPLKDLIDSEKKEKLRDALSQLDNKYKEVLLLRIYNDLSIEEISAKIGIEKRRVSERINYALKLLLKELKKKNYFQYPDSFNK